MSTPTISLVVTDLDGTLWHTDDHISETVIAAIEVLAERQIPLLVATGRRLHSTATPLAQYGLEPPAVVLNGALGVDLSSGQRFHSLPYPTEQAVAVLAAFNSVGLDPVVYVDHPDFEAFLSETPATHRGHVAMLGDSASVDDLQRVVSEESVLGFSMIGAPHADGVAAQAAIGELAETHLDRSIDFAGYCAFTVSPIGQSKWDGVLAFCRLNSLDPGRVLSLGDGSNDLELLGNSAVSLVPKVAHPAALELADHVIGAAADGGWAEILEFLD